MAKAAKNIKTHIVPRLVYTGKPLKVYDDLGGWFIIEWNDGKNISVFAPGGVNKINGKQLGYHMGEIYTGKDTPHKEGLAYLVGFNRGNTEWKNIPWDINDREGAIRYIWLQTQIPLKEEKQLRGYISKILFEQEEDTSLINFNDKIEIPGIEGWYAKRIDDPAALPGWTIRRQSKFGYFPIGQIYDNGLLDYRVGTESNEREKGRMDLANNPIKAARYIWLKRQAPITENVIQEGFRARFKFPDINNWYTDFFVLGGLDSYYVICDKKGHNVGQLELDNIQHEIHATLHYNDGSGVTDEWSDTIDWPAPVNGQTQEEYIKQAVRYVFMQRSRYEHERAQELGESKTQDVLNSSGHKKIIDIPGLDGWIALRIVPNKSSQISQAWWSIYKDTKGQNKGSFKSAEQYVGAIFDNGKLNIKLPDRNTIIETRPDLVNNPVQAARYMYLKLQKPITEKYVSPTLKERVIEYPDINNWFATIYSGGLVTEYDYNAIYNELGVLEGDLTESELDGGGYTLRYYEDDISQQNDELTAIDWPNPIEGQDFDAYLKQAVRYVFLKRATPIEPDI